MPVQVQPYSYHAPRTTVSNSQRAMSQQIKQQVAFGDGSAPTTYDYSTEINNLRLNNHKIEGDTPEQAFTSFYNTVEKGLKTVAKAEDDKVAAGKWKPFAPGRRYFVKTEMMDKVPKELFVKSMSGFVREYGTKPALNDHSSAISSFIQNKMGIVKGSNWNPWKQNQQYGQLEDVMTAVYKGFLKTGNCIIKSMK